MKILHVHKFFDPFRGAENYMHELMREQERRGHEVHAFSTRSPNNLPSPDASRFVTRYDFSRSEGAGKDARKAVNFLWNREAKQAMERMIREVRPDVIHLHNIYHHLSSSILAPIRRSGIACVQTLHDLKLACPNYRMYTEGSPCERCKGGKYYEAIRHRCVWPSFIPNVLAAAEMYMTKARQSYERTVKTFICPSDFMARRMEAWGEPASKCTVIRMPMTHRPQACRGGGYLLAVGSLTPEKGYEELVQAAKNAPHVHIKVAGRGPLEDRLRSLIRTSHVTNVELVGYARGEGLEELYRHAEGFVACPVGYENAPLAVLDAVAHGLPILATEIGGLPEMVEQGKSGYLVGRGDIGAWTEALRNFADRSEAERSAMANASHAMGYSRFPSWDTHAQSIEACYGA